MHKLDRMIAIVIATKIVVEELNGQLVSVGQQGHKGRYLSGKKIAKIYKNYKNIHRKSEIARKALGYG